MATRQLPLFDLPVRLENGAIVGPLPAGSPLVVSYGIGTDSTALIVELQRRGIRPDAILFSNPGNEKVITYEYIAVMDSWLATVDFPPLTIVRYQPQKFKWNPYRTLAGNCISNRTLPSLAFGYKSCSLKWKGAVLDKEVTHQFGGQPVYRAVGYDCSPKDMRRFATASGKANKERPDDVFIYPLQVWGYDRRDCERIIDEAGLPQPGKSSCHFCPAMKPEEVDELPLEQLVGIVVIEANASPNLETVAGLWRKSRITDYIRERGLLPGDVIDRLWAKWSGARVITDMQLLSEDVLNQEIINVMEEISGKVQVV
ncbi:MAG: hypothetical protein FOGNACKC_00778 [Anaerolineae bacterium]|nr:hypothetical protein [Anaerolineae bacterium]